MKDTPVTEFINAVFYVCLRLGNKTVKKHRVVAEQWIPNPENKPEVDHRNQNPIDNHKNNLRWVTEKENMGNRRGYGGKAHERFDQLPENCQVIKKYGNHEIKNLFYNGENIYKYETLNNQYRKLNWVEIKSKGNVTYKLQIDRIHFSKSVLDRMMQEGKLEPIPKPIEEEPKLKVIEEESSSSSSTEEESSSDEKLYPDAYFSFDLSRNDEDY